MVAKSSAKRSGCHWGTMWNMAPSLIRLVRSPSTAANITPLGITSYPSCWKWCSVSQNVS